MYKQVEKPKEYKSQSVTNTVFQKQSFGVSTFQFMDNRPEAIAQRKLQEKMNNCPQVKQLMSNNIAQLKIIKIRNVQTNAEKDHDDKLPIPIGWIRSQTVQPEQPQQISNPFDMPDLFGGFRSGLVPSAPAQPNEETEEAPTEKKMTFAEILRASGSPESTHSSSQYTGPPLTRTITNVPVNAPMQVREGAVIACRVLSTVGDLVFKCEVTLKFSRGSVIYNGMLCIHQHQHGNLEDVSNLHFKKTHDKEDKNYGEVPSWVINKVYQIT